MHGAMPTRRLKRCLAPLDVMADHVDHGFGAFHRRADRRLLPHVGVNRGDLPRPAAPLEERCAFGMAHRDAHTGAVGGQALDDLPTEEA